MLPRTTAKSSALLRLSDTVPDCQTVERQTPWT
jgi:hypothetical protein